MNKRTPKTVSVSICSVCRLEAKNCLHHEGLIGGLREIISRDVPAPEFKAKKAAERRGGPAVW